MFKNTDEELKKLGALITTREIQQQPELWIETLNNYMKSKANINKFINEAKSKSNGEKIRVIFVGAGTSQYVGDTITPYLNKIGDIDNFTFESIATTDIVASPLDYLKAKEMTILVSFARSGNSPESVATVELAEDIIENLLQITITCDPKGQLAKKAQSEDNNLLLMQPLLANDKGFAMTGSFSCMALTALLTFDQSSDDDKKKWIDQVFEMGKEVINREDEIQEITNFDFDRITYLGSGSFSGLAREAQLKVLELTAGQVTTIFDSSMGFRHGPKSYVNNKTVVFNFLSNDPYTRQYDLDVIEEIKSDKIAQRITAVGVEANNNFSGNNFIFEKGSVDIPEGYMALPYVMFAQTFALQCSLKVNNKPDTPSASGTVNRVVKGVILHEFIK